MGEEPLVEETLEEGARLLDAIGFDIGRAVWAFDPELSQWQLLIGIPKGASRLEVYSLIQHQIKEDDLRLDLDQITLVKEYDPALHELRNSFAHSSSLTSPIQYEFAGRTLTNARPVRRSPRVYEQHVLTALTRIGPPGLPIRRHQEWPWGVRVDAVIELPHARVLVEVKALGAPLSFNQLLNTIGLFTLARQALGPATTGSLIVTPAGASKQAALAAETLPGLALAAWNGQRDDDALRESLETLSQPPLGSFWL